MSSTSWWDTIRARTGAPTTSWWQIGQRHLAAHTSAKIIDELDAWSPHDLPDPHGDHRARRAAYYNEHTDTDTLRDSLASEPEPGLRQLCALHPRQQARSLHRHAVDHLLHARDLTAVANNPSIGADTARLVYDTRIRGVHLSLAANPATPPELLDQLAHDACDNPDLRWKAHEIVEQLAGNPNTAEATLTYLAGQDIHEFGRGLLSNPNQPAPDVVAHASGRDRVAALRALRHPDVTTDALHTLIVWCRTGGHRYGLLARAGTHRNADWRCVRELDVTVAFQRPAPGDIPDLTHPVARIVEELAAVGFAGTTGELVDAARQMAAPGSSDTIST